MIEHRQQNWRPRNRSKWHEVHISIVKRPIEFSPVISHSRNKKPIPVVVIFYVWFNFNHQQRRGCDTIRTTKWLLFYCIHFISHFYWRFKTKSRFHVYCFLIKWIITISHMVIATSPITMWCVYIFTIFTRKQIHINIAAICCAFKWCDVEEKKN